MTQKRVVGLFAGVGGIETGFTQAGFNPIFSNEINEQSVITYRANYTHTLLEGDINDIVSANLPDHEITVGGFPCQPFSIAGLRQGFNDTKGRGNVFFKIMEILKTKKPGIILLENVKNLVTHDSGNTFKVIVNALEEEGYYLKYKVLNAKDHGNIPQTRERIFIVGFRNPEHAAKFTFPEAIPLTAKLSDFIDFEAKVEDRYYYTAEKNKFYSVLEEAITQKDTIYQWRRSYVRTTPNGLAPTLTAFMGTGGNNVPMIYTDHGIRKLTPRECFNLMGFPQDFILPAEVANSHLYKQAGNAVVVPVVKRIAESISEAIKE
ncbi:MAG: DNA cytosine methyltransferase [Enterococcus sp.]|nr:DNA cytosine methyltransferase [Enterococcus sp.]